MRDFFIRSMEMILNVVVVIAFIGLVVVAGMVGFGNAGGPGGMGGGPLAGLIVLVVGAIYLILVFGFMFLRLGIYQNTLRAANAMEHRA
jgi:uncharacterized membrane protein